MKNKSKKLIVRQGDVLVIKTDSIPTNLKKTVGEKVTLALGEVTGHHHSFSEPSVIGYAEGDVALADYFEITSESATLTHQEHNPITLPKGNYESLIQVQYTPEEIRNVAD